ncbi:MAG: hypothetical protein AMXMBFR52_15180 [Burkholderiales bacterium]
MRIARDWNGEPDDAMIALHARRSAAVIAAFAASGRPVALVLTGTDLYRDIRHDRDAQRALALARPLVVLQTQGLDELPAALRAHATVIEQSAPALAPGTPRRRTFDLLLVGHLRAEKDPLTAVRALARLDDAPSRRLRLIHVGGAHDEALARQMREAAHVDARIELRGPLAHAATRALIRRGRLLLLPSLIEGGANVLIEAVTAGVPVLASRIGGSIGLLGADYPGLFPAGDDAALATLIRRCRDEPGFLEWLRAHCARCAWRFTPQREAAAVLALAHNLLARGRAGGAPAPTSGNIQP